MGTLRVYTIALDPTSAFAPDRLDSADFGEVVARYWMEVGCGTERLSVRYAVAVKSLGRGEEFVSAWPEHTREFMGFLLELGGDPLRSPVQWSRVLSSVVASVHRGIERVFPTEFATDAVPGTSRSADGG